MARAVQLRRAATDLVSWHQDQAVNTTIYILRELGPVGFLLKEEGISKYFKVNIGNIHTCNCSTFLKEKDLCKHICWILLKKFKLPRGHEYAFQLGLVDREIEILLNSLHTEQAPQSLPNKYKKKQKDEEIVGAVCQKEIDPEDVCPICQEELLKKKQPVTYCRYSCGNNVHIKCMKIWAEHQVKTESETIAKCPLCRKEFAPLSLLQEEFRNSTKLLAAERERLDKHLGIPCNNCQVCPIQGKCYRCLRCPDFHLCQECFPRLNHPKHEFTYREKRNQRWKPVQQVSGMPLPLAVINDLMNREIVSNDYDLLLQLDRNRSNTVPGHIVLTLPLLIVKEQSKLLVPGQQCRVCLKAFQLRQQVRWLPCHHKFHKDCIDHWLLHESNSCPIDGHAVYNPLTWDEGSSRCKKREAFTNSEHSSSNIQPDKPQFAIPVIGYHSSLRKSSNQTYGQLNQNQRQRGYGDQNSINITKDFAVNGLNYFRLNEIKNETSIDQGHNIQHSIPGGMFEEHVPGLLPDTRGKNNSAAVQVEAKDSKDSQIKKRNIVISKTHSAGLSGTSILQSMHNSKSNSTELSPQQILQVELCPHDSSSIQRTQSSGLKGEIRKQVGLLSRKVRCASMSSATECVSLAMEGVAVNTRL
ncbi:E3 ubiquitin-protein ligase ZSWIM2 isoform X1 [Chiloscyllium plagiosum]|uniref:E3 ubiquitin-protein ligase ZSWIM2 isoform X1 n=1 Tax=Chiloscyllium plagiosum TaxID=36176 RepID=UPI001CB7E574|nr:E3 ubiquitin-protein ligase ZSWIM2 isoform X1 [Chiloscyllium plagiosum]XP_043549374.1 E3 ubiquitin-protein ligase ZSWIM2 isoform X1 [Chiloscyllium plagiosum]XP_043549375.1 E3 ubiquitin-protein ligase ZSWIM2 isoform X1 [Chiloscyllium plagiosum]